MNPFASVECLLSLPQFVQANSHVNTLYSDPSALVLAKSESISVSIIFEVLESPPTVILQYCAKDGILKRLISEVYI